MSSDRRFLVVFCILMVAALFPAAGTGCANQIALGYVSYDPSTAEPEYIQRQQLHWPLFIGDRFPRANLIANPKCHTDPDGLVWRCRCNLSRNNWTRDVVRRAL